MNLKKNYACMNMASNIPLRNPVRIAQTFMNMTSNKTL